MFAKAVSPASTTRRWYALAIAARPRTMRTTERHESPISIWARRAISVPLYLVLAAVAFGGAPLWLFAAAVVDVATGAMRRFPRVRALLFFGVYLGCEVVGMTIALGLGVGLVGGRVGGRGAYVAANAALQRAWTTALFKGAVTVFSMKVDVEGLEHARSGPLLLFVRHASTADTVLAAALVANPNRLLLRYVLKRELLWDPCLDIVGRRLPNAFVDRKAPRSAGEIQAVARLAEGLDGTSAVLIYPEGTRFAPAKLERAVAALRERVAAAPGVEERAGMNQLADVAARFRHVLPPRLGGPLALLAAAPDVDVVFLEHTGLDEAASFSRFWRGGLIGKTLRVRLRRFAAAEIPVDRRDGWLFDRWAEVDDWIALAREGGGAASP